jgi:uncharacterized protein (TIGR00730 family)
LANRLEGRPEAGDDADPDRHDTAAGEPSREALQERIRESSSFARADRDLALLARPELRPVRLQLEYVKPELAFADLGIEHTIVVFGSTRLPDPETARRRLAEAEADIAASAAERADRVARARKALERSRWYEIGRELGRLVGLCGSGPGDNRLVVVTGGGPGGMEAANRGAYEVGAASVGLNINLPHEQAPNPYISPELCFQFRYFGLRKLHFMMRAKALVALPGGYGTFDEVFETLCLIQTRKRSLLPVVLVGEAFWRRAVDFEFLAEEGVIDPADLALFRFAESAQEAWNAIVGWYEMRGQSIFEPAQTDRLDPNHHE